MTQARVELTGECEGCGASDGILTGHGDHFCPKCAANIDQREQAERHLIIYLTAALAPCRDHWEARGFTAQNMAELLETSAQEIFDALKQEAGSA